MDWLFRRRVSQSAAAGNGESESASLNLRDKFTQRARAVLSYSQEEAQRRGHSLLGPEHLLLGLIHDEGCVASIILKSIGVPLDQVRQAVESRMQPRSESLVQAGAIAPATKSVIQRSADEAYRFRHHYIGTEHLLLGVIAEEESAAAEALRELGIQQGLVRRAVREGARAQPLPSADPPSEGSGAPEEC